jgi:TolA-binding protein
MPLALIGAALFLPAPAPAAASKEMQDLQRDVAQLQDQVSALQKALDSKLGAIEAQLQQAIDTANKTNSNVNSLNSGVTQTMQSELKGVRDQLSGVTGLSVKVDNTSNDISDLHNAVAGLVATVNKQQLLLNDILNQVKLLQAPAAAPPPPAGDAGTPGASGPPPMASTLFKSGVDDMNGGRAELALNDFSTFLRLYPNDDNGRAVHYNIGEIYYGQGKAEQAVNEFDAAIEQYSADPILTPEAYYMKGMALKKLGKTKDAISAFRAVTNDFPHSDEAAKARAQLTAMGANTPASRSKK